MQSRARTALIILLTLGLLAVFLGSVDIRKVGTEIRRASLLPLLRRSDLVFAGPHEAALVVPGAGGPEELAQGICDLGPGGAVIKLGAEGAYALLDGLSHRQPAVPVRVHDTVGAGDAFAAGYLAELLAGEPPERRLRTAAVLGAFAVSTAGDWEGLPRRSELELLDHHDDIVR